MVRTFWHTNHIRSPKTSASSSADSAQRLSSDVQKVGCTILQDYQNDIKKRFRNGGASAKWKEYLESRKTVLKRAAVQSSVDESTIGSSLNAVESLKLQASEMSSVNASSTSTLEWRMEAFLLLSEDYQRYSMLISSYLLCSLLFTVMLMFCQMQEFF